MKRLEKQLKVLQDHLTNLSARADKARGQTRRRLKRLERRTRVKVERTMRTLEPKVRQAVAEAAHFGHPDQFDRSIAIAPIGGS